jgi:hypothetical protein
MTIVRRALAKSMSVKDFSQKHSIALFYATIILFITTAIFGFMTFSHMGHRGGFGQRNYPSGAMKNNNVLMQDAQGQVPDQTDQAQ